MDTIKAWQCSICGDIALCSGGPPEDRELCDWQEMNVDEYFKELDFRSKIFNKVRSVWNERS